MRKSELITIVAGVGTLILLIISGVVLTSAMKRTKEMADNRDDSFAQLDKIYRERIFPDRKNIGLIQQQTTDATRWVSNLVASQQNVVTFDDKLTPSQFMQVLQPAVRHLARTKNQGGSPMVGEGFAFGFDAYITGGQMPTAANIPKLALQWELTQRICKELFAANISALQSITRDNFESAVARVVEAPVSTGRRRGRTAVAEADKKEENDPRALKGDQPFTVEFTARKDTLLAVLNRLAATDLFITVERVTVKKTDTDVKSLPDKWATLKQVPHAQRVVAGPEIDPPLAVRLILKVTVF